MVESVELWRPSESRKTNSQMWLFMQHMSNRAGAVFDDYASLHRYSVSDPNEFWSELFDWFNIAYEGELSPANLDSGFEQYGWFPKVSLNFAENLLAKGEEQHTALISVLENGHQRSLTYSQLRAQVSTFQNTISSDFSTGDVLACYMPNVPETAVAMLAATALGGVFTSTSSDFGIDGVIDRFSQSKPSVLVAAAGYYYGGKYFDCLPKISEVISQVPSIKRVFVVCLNDDSHDFDDHDLLEPWPNMSNAIGTPSFVPRAFADPLYIMYSSGTTGKPKCIVHSVGGTLIQNIKELGLHCDLTAEKRIFFFTTCGWMMWNWLISSLYFGSTVVLYDGSPGFPSMPDYLGMIEKHQINIFGTSPKFLRALEDSNTALSSLNLDSLETILSTGSPLLPEQYDFVYQNLKSDVLLSSIAGGTDILGCFYGGNPVLPVYRGECQCAPLGMDSACVDENGAVLIGEEGELVCLQSFPSRPIYFLDDPNNERLNKAYFDRYPGLWHHGDYILVSEYGGAVFFGRSDSTLNPGGVRIGTSEIYRQTEPLHYIEDSVCIGRKIAGDVEVALFVKMVEDEQLTQDRTNEIKLAIRSKTTPRHVPRHVIQVNDIPYTRSGKKIEGVVGNLINGRPVNNIEAIINPECLEEYQMISVTNFT